LGARAAAGTTTGSIFWVEHTPTHAGAAEALPTNHAGELASPHPEVLRNRLCVLPTGFGEPEPAFTVWETRWPMDTEGFQVFIDGPNSPTGADFTNRVHSVIWHSAWVQSAAFPAKSSFVRKMGLPFVDDTMGMMGSMAGVMHEVGKIVAEEDEELAAPALEMEYTPSTEPAEALEKEQVPYGEWRLTPAAEATKAAIEQKLKRPFKIKQYKRIVMQAPKWPTDAE
jgi:hypothetical protein